MKVFSVEFKASCLLPEEYPRESCPEVAFVARSNVGKSSAINVLLQRKGIARVSATPGKTQRIHFIKVNGRFFFVDLPGYGYAKAAKTTRVAWAQAIEKYFARRDQLCGVVMLLDARHPPTALDVQMKAYLEHFGYPAVYVATKIDKVPRNGRRKCLEAHKRVLGLGKSQEVHPFSAKTGEGREPLWRLIQALIGLG